MNPAQEDLSDHFPTGATFSYALPEPEGAPLAALLTLVILATRRRSFATGPSAREVKADRQEGKRRHHRG